MSCRAATHKVYRKLLKDLRLIDEDYWKED